MKNLFMTVAVAVITLSFAHAQVSAEEDTKQQKEKVVKEGVVVAVRGKANVWLPGGYIK